MKTLIVGIASLDLIEERTLAIARGEYKPTKKEPKVWFSSIESMAQVLSTKNKMLLEIIAEYSPKNMRELAELSGRDKGNLSKTLKTMSRYGLVELQPGMGKELMPVIPYDTLQINVESSFKNHKTF